MTVYGLDSLGTIRGRGKLFFSWPPRSDRMYGPTNFLLTWVSFAGGKGVGGRNSPLIFS